MHTQYLRTEGVAIYIRQNIVCIQLAMLVCFKCSIFSLKDQEQSQWAVYNHWAGMGWTGFTGLPLKLKIQPYYDIMVPTFSHTYVR